MTDKILDNDPAHRLIAKFFGNVLPEIGKGSVLEIGSRARSGHSRKALVPGGFEYIGFDINDGPNVDVVGDAHKLSHYFEAEKFDAIFSISVFEHIAMPWKVAVELGKVLRTGGIMMHVSHQTWPVHETPWDFWRYSKETWKCIFNTPSGFEVLDAEMGEPGHVHPDYIHPAVKDLSNFPVYLMSAVICKKLSPSELKWDVDISEITAVDYPY